MLDSRCHVAAGCRAAFSKTTTKSAEKPRVSRRGSPGEPSYNGGGRLVLELVYERRTYCARERCEDCGRQAETEDSPGVHRLQ
jgi:hypothetical protein